MATWRDELQEVIKSQAERDAEEQERKRKRLEQALVVAEEAMAMAQECLRYADEQLRGKGQPSSLDEGGDQWTLALSELRVVVSLARESAVIKVIYDDGRPRDFDFVEERHTSPKDVEEYVGRRTVELARAAQIRAPW